MLKLSERSKTPGINLRYNMACAKGDQPVGVDLHAVLDRIEADILQNTKK